MRTSGKNVRSPAPLREKKAYICGKFMHIAGRERTEAENGSEKVKKLQMPADSREHR